MTQIGDLRAQITPEQQESQTASITYSHKRTGSLDNLSLSLSLSLSLEHKYLDMEIDERGGGVSKVAKLEPLTDGSGVHVQLKTPILYSFSHRESKPQWREHGAIVPVRLSY